MTDPTSSQANGWFEEYVVHRLDETSERLDRFEKKLDGLLVMVPRLEERGRIVAILFGVLGGFLPTLGALIYFVTRQP